MLSENEVVDRVADWLRAGGAEVIHARKGTSKGHDIEAVSASGNDIYIECKGQRGDRADKEFSLHYHWQCASGAVFNQLKLRAEVGERVQVGIALPHSDTYREVLGELPTVLVNNRILFLWVSESDGVFEHECT